MDTITIGGPTQATVTITSNTSANITIASNTATLTTTVLAEGANNTVVSVPSVQQVGPLTFK